MKLNRTWTTLYFGILSHLRVIRNQLWSRNHWKHLPVKCMLTFGFVLWNIHLCHTLFSTLYKTTDSFLDQYGWIIWNFLLGPLMLLFIDEESWRLMMNHFCGLFNLLFLGCMCEFHVQSFSSWKPVTFVLGDCSILYYSGNKFL